MSLKQEDLSQNKLQRVFVCVRACAHTCVHGCVFMIVGLPTCATMWLPDVFSIVFGAL